MKKSIFVILYCITIFTIYGCSSDSAHQGRTSSGDLDYSALSTEFSDAQSLLSEELLTHVPGNNRLLQFRTLLEEIELMVNDKSAISQKEIDATRDWLKKQSKRITMWAPREFPSPYPLIKTGDKVIPAPQGVEDFYSKYTNAYDDDYTQGIPIVAPDEVPDEYLLKQREVVNMLLRKRPDVRAAMVAQNYSMGMGISESEFNKHPRRNFQTLQEIDRYGGISQFCPLEEFLHAMQGIGIQKVDPHVSREIVDAYKAAIEKGGIFDPFGTIGSEDEWALLDLTAEDFKNDDVRKRLYLSPKIVSSFVIDEYFALGVCSWHGNTYPTEYLLTTREEIGKKDPLLDSLIRRYFIDDDWRCASASKQHSR